MTIIAILPAHNEEAGIVRAVESLRHQTLVPDRIVVVSDNSSDRTVELATQAGAEVIETVGNVHRKAGALNQALALFLPNLDAGDFVHVQDADSILDPGFIACAVETLRGSQSLGGAGGTFLGEEDGTLVGWFQRNEYARYKRDVQMKRGKSLVLTGTASVFPVRVLNEVAYSRGGEGTELPGEYGLVYDTRVLTEDNELSLAIQTLGYSIIQPNGCSLTTEVMGTWRELSAQRTRWKRGAVENLMDYGLSRVTLKYWVRQALAVLTVLVTVLYLVSLALIPVLGIELRWYWMTLTGIFSYSQTVTVWTRGWKARIVAATLVVEGLYDLFLQGVQARAFVLAMIRAERRW